jgi:hypothetical protein
LRISGQKINVCAQTLAGKTVNIEIGADNRVVDLKRTIAQKEGTSINQTLIFNNKQLEDNKFLREYNIVDNSVLCVIYNPGFDKTSSHGNSDNRISNNCQQNGSPFTHYRHHSENGSHSIDHLIHNNSTAMGFRNTDMNMKSDSIPFSHWKSHTHDWNLEPKCLSSSSLSYRTPK